MNKFNSNNKPFPKGKVVAMPKDIIAKIEVETPHVIKYGKNGVFTSAAVVVKNGPVSWWDVRAEIYN